MKRKENRRLRAPVMKRKGFQPSRAFRFRRSKQVRYAQMNATLSSQINFDRLPPGDILDVNSNGVVIVDPNNPVHRQWLED
ncbi:hypothetical protein [Parageobacillus galactosidasius]|uniref:Uncharacterized protein n=1 Tax=Parageobacillus galactosidasius TaxID=883812 RepID=A0A226QT79_9BACL|nr:hypothetical protein [Parageobacillus galactosidasius]OXB94897.1 hypothetical protein B9L23_08525 [Parageobacillus galactosidasius]